jgi:DHA1 family tetracycline resistance protein-like MFS transporter
LNATPQSNDATPATVGKPRRATIVFILITILLDVLSLGVTIPVAPKLIEGMVFQIQWPQLLADQKPEFCSEVIETIRKNRKPDAVDLDEADSRRARLALQADLGLSAEEATQSVAARLAPITATAAFYVGLFGFVWALMQFVCAPILGALSDRFGRRKVILISCVGLGLDYILMALAPDLTWLFIGRIISGITAASFATAAAYIADVSPPEKRAASYGLVGAAWGVGFIVGPGLGGFLGGWFGVRVPFWVAAGLTLANAAYGFFVLPESLAPENRSAFSWRRANPLGSFKLLRSHPELLGLASVLLLYQLAHQVFPSVFVLYAGHRYEWGADVVGLTLMVVGIVGVFMQGYMVRRTASMLGEVKMLFIGLGSGALGYFIYGIADNGWFFWSAIPVFSLVGYFTPAIQGLMTRRVSSKEQGQLQGANSSMMGIAGMLGPLIFTAIFAAGIDPKQGIHLPGAPFFLATTLHLVAVCVAIVILRRGRTRS